MHTQPRLVEEEMHMLPRLLGEERRAVLHGDGSWISRQFLVQEGERCGFMLKGQQGEPPFPSRVSHSSRTHPLTPSRCSQEPFVLMVSAGRHQNPRELPPPTPPNNALLGGIPTPDLDCGLKFPGALCFFCSTPCTKHNSAISALGGPSVTQTALVHGSGIRV